LSNWVKREIYLRKKFALAGAIIVIIVLLSVFGMYFVTYNNLVSLQASTESSWAQVDTQLQRRYDLIPNLVSAAQAYMGYESQVLQNVTRLRTAWTEAEQTGNVSDINDATAQLEGSVSNLIISFEAYPDLKASQVMQDLMISLEGTENRIATSRMNYNDAVRDYNVAIKAFPGVFFAANGGFSAKSYFEATIAATQTVKVDL
jgi:LemA protein